MCPGTVADRQRTEVTGIMVRRKGLGLRLIAVFNPPSEHCCSLAIHSSFLTLTLILYVAHAYVHITVGLVVRGLVLLLLVIGCMNRRSDLGGE
jgi:hypothetical protein